MANLLDEYPCPACGFLTFGEPPGSYGICDVCNWEDDHVQLAHPTMQGGANKDSLLKCQQQILIEIPSHITEYKGFKRDSKWRPLNEQDCAINLAAPINGISYFNAATEDAPLYYWQIHSGHEEKQNKPTY